MLFMNLSDIFCQIIWLYFSILYSKKTKRGMLLHIPLAHKLSTTPESGKQTLPCHMVNICINSPNSDFIPYFAVSLPKYQRNGVSPAGASNHFPSLSAAFSFCSGFSETCCFSCPSLSSS